MKDLEIRTTEMFVHVCDFGLKHLEAFPPNEPGGQWFATFREEVKQLKAYAAEQLSGRAGFREAAALKIAAERELQTTLELIRITARALGNEYPGLDRKYRLPGSPNSTNLLSTAASFAKNVTSEAQLFIEHQMAPDFVEKLKVQTDAYAQAISARDEARKTHVNATRGIQKSMLAASIALQHIDAIVANVYKDDDLTVADWEHVRHTERAWKSKTPAKPDGINGGKTAGDTQSIEIAGGVHAETATA